MILLKAIPILNTLIDWIRNKELIDHLKQELAEVKAQRDAAQVKLVKHITKSRGAQKKK